MSIERIPVSDREAWLKLRQQDVTASAAGALLGVHDYMTPFALWGLKTGALKEDPEESDAMKRGRLLEPVAVQLLREQYPEWKVQHGVFYLRDTEARLGGTPDLFVDCPERGRGIVQIKSVEGSIFRKKWRDPDTNEIAPPLWIAVQGIVEAYLDGAQWAAVAPLVVGFGIDVELIDIPIHPGVIDKVKAETAKFWDIVARNEAPPADYGRDGEALLQLYAQDNGNILDLTEDNRLPELCANDELLREQQTKIDKQREEIRNEIIAKLGKAAGAICAGWEISAKTVSVPAKERKAYSFRSIRKKPLKQFEEEAA